MDGIPAFNSRSDALQRRDEPGLGDDVLCVKCGGALDTGLECSECGHDNYEAVTGKPFAAKLLRCGRAGALEYANQRLRVALKTMLCDTEDSEYMTGKEREVMARQVLADLGE